MEEDGLTGLKGERLKVSTLMWVLHLSIYRCAVFVEIWIFKYGQV